MPRYASYSSAVVAVLLLSTPANAQRGLRPFETCTIQVLNQTVYVKDDGTWVIPNIPANGGQVRARLHCTNGLSTRVGQSGYFTIKPNRMNAIRPIEFEEPDPGPTEIVVGLPEPLLTEVGATTQLQVLGTFPDGSEQDITPSAEGTNYQSTRPDVASVNAEGQVAAFKSGTAVVAVWNEGVTSAVWVTVKIGNDTDEDGLPDDYETEVGLDPNDPVDALVDQDADNLTALKEFELGTHPFLPDTDGDGIQDGEEVVAGEDGWVTNPVLKDTDGDLIPDQVEIDTATDPTDSASFDFDAALLGLEIAPALVVLVFNPVVGEASAQLKVVGLLIDGSGIDLTDHVLVSYSSLDISVANFGITPGEVFAGTEGKTKVIVQLASHEAEVPVTVKTFAPQPLAMLPLDCPGNGVSIAAGHVYVACGGGGLKVVSLAPPNSPTIVGTLPAAGNANDVWSDGSTAYVASGAAGLQVIDVSQPTAPGVVGALDTLGDAWAVELQGDIAYVADHSGGLLTVSVANPKLPAQVGVVDVSQPVRDVAVSGGLAVAVRTNGSVAVVDVSDPSLLVKVGELPAIGNGARSVVMAAEYAFLATGNSGVHVVSLADPTAPAVVGNGGSGQYMLSDVALAGSLLFGADYYRVNSVPIVQTFIPEEPLFVGVVEFSQFNDDNGVTIDADPQFVAMVGSNGIIAGKPASGATRLFIGQHDDLNDPFGVPPTCVIVQPQPNTLATEGANLSVQVLAVDDVFVQEVEVLLDDQSVQLDALAPYELKVKLPKDLELHVIGARAYDTGGNVGICEPVFVQLQEDPLTTVVGAVVDDQGLPVSDAQIVLQEELLTATSDVDGTFTIAGAPTYDDIQLTVQGIVGEDILFDAFGPFEVIPAGITDVGELLLQTPIGSTRGTALVARPVAFYGTSGIGPDGGSVAGPLAARPVTFYGSKDVTVDTEPMGPVVARPVTFYGSAFLTNADSNVAGPVVARPVTFFGSADTTLDTDPMGPVVARPVTFFGSPGTTATDEPLGPVVARPVTFVDQPRVFSVDPETVGVGLGTATLALSGVGFEDAEGVSFYLNGAPTALLEATAIDVDPSGTAMDLTFTIDPATPVGVVTIIIVTADGTSPTDDLGANSFDLTE